MKRIILILMATLVLPSFVSAQQIDSLREDVSIVDSTSLVPTTTVVPILNSPDTTEIVTVHAARVACAAAFAASIDSLVATRNYTFYPNSIRELPDGHIRWVHVNYFYLTVEDDLVVAHLPLEHSSTKSFDVLNFEEVKLSDYLASSVSYGWQINFRLSEADQEYLCCIDVFHVTGEVVMTLSHSNVVMRYSGSFTPPKGL